MKNGRGKKLGRRARAREASALAERAQLVSSREGAPPWYVAEGKRGQHLLEQGRVAEATEIFQAILGGLGETPSYARALILGRLGRCLHLSGQTEPAVARLRAAVELAGTLAPGAGVRALRGSLECELGDTLFAAGRLDQAKAAYVAALSIAEELRDVRAQAVDLGQLGAVEFAEGRLDQALNLYQAALRLLQPLHEPALAAATCYQLARIHHHREEWDDAERHYRAAIELDRQVGDAPRLARHLGNLADLLQLRRERLSEARALAEEALATAQTHDPTRAVAWQAYGLLADIAAREAATLPAGEPRAALDAEVRDYRELERRAPVIVAALGSVLEGPNRGRAVLLGQLARCFNLGRRADLALAWVRDGLAVLNDLAPSAGVSGLRSILLSELGDSLGALGQYDEAREAYRASLDVSEELKDLRGQARGLVQLGGLAAVQGRIDEARESCRSAVQLIRELEDLALESATCEQLDLVLAWKQGGAQVDRQDSEGARLPERRGAEDDRGAEPAGVIAVMLYDDVATDYGFEPNLLVEGRWESRVARSTGQPGPLASHVRPRLVLGTRCWTEEDGAVRFRLPAGEPAVETESGCMILRRTRRDVVVRGNPRLVGRLIRGLDGTTTVAEILGWLDASDREPAGGILAALADAGAIDVSGRAIGRFLHAATKKGVLPAGGLEADDVLRLATDMTYRAYPDAPRIPLCQSAPERLQALHALTRSRRSQRDYSGRLIGREQFDALLHTACGVTGAMPWGGREVKLRAYPSSGALYAVEIYPVVFQVEELEPAVYHYRAVEHALEVVRAGVDPAGFIGAALPMERQMVSGAAAMVCLTGFFPRHERKYGEGGYRMMVAEAGHISQNLVLAATALGLSARPFGGVFDHLLNQELGLDGADEQFLLAVLVGHVAGKAGPGQ
jgi:SagB-type dehydrogenase family enzyme